MILTNTTIVGTVFRSTTIGACRRAYWYVHFTVSNYSLIQMQRMNICNSYLLLNLTWFNLCWMRDSTWFHDKISLFMNISYLCITDSHNRAIFIWRHDNVLQVLLIYDLSESLTIHVILLISKCFTEIALNTDKSV